MLSDWSLMVEWLKSGKASEAFGDAGSTNLVQVGWRLDNLHHVVCFLQLKHALWRSIFADVIEMTAC